MYPRLPLLSIAEDDLEPLMLTSCLACVRCQCLGYRCLTPCPVYVVLGTELRVLYMVGKHSTNGATHPPPKVLYMF